MGQERLLRSASRMAVITAVCRITGYLRDKALVSVLGAGHLNDAYRTANRIPNAFRALFAEGSLHAAFVPLLAQLTGKQGDRREARDLVGGLLAALVLLLSTVVAIGILIAPLLVRLYAAGFAETPGKLELTIYMNRIMFPYLALISLAALCQGIINSHERFLLPAATPMLFNITIAGVAWAVVPRVANPAPVLAVAVLVGGFLQFVAQIPAVWRLGFRLLPVWRQIWNRRVREVLLLMLPGIPVLGINQLNQLISNRFASFLGPAVVTYTYSAYRVTELAFGTVVVQLTTVLLPMLSRELREAPQQATATLLNTVRMVCFVTIPAATVMAIVARPVIGLLFGGGRFNPEDVAITGATLAAYSFSLVGTGHSKVMASAFFAHSDTRTPMWGSLVALLSFAPLCWLLAARLGPPGLGLANTMAMFCFAAFLTGLYAKRYGLGPIAPTAKAVVRIIGASAVVGAVLVRIRPWLADIDHTSLLAVLKLAAVLIPVGVLYVGLVRLTGGREVDELWAALGRKNPKRGKDGKETA